MHVKVAETIESAPVAEGDPTGREQPDMLSAKSGPCTDFDGASATDLDIDIGTAGGPLYFDPIFLAIYNDISSKIAKHIMFYRDLILAGELLDNVNV
ncbi:hypothetical protein LRX75_05125 [Rhizobium sp. DKSPLA3]|uniref:Uncharacterized protein n=1 Tax=Rhizobium quercicola TaxID=2901226 RepID=A0A9X1NQF4_9HYPH|nr:hypothetical protein [Rhizobium quercicola]MCD7108425.1 hypothetical protein [Rhizobium quercicola]